MTTSPWLGCGLTLRHEPDGHTFLETTDLALLRDRLGVPVFLAFARLSVGANQLATLHHVLELNDRDGPGRTRVATNRNLIILIFFSWGVLHEISTAIINLKEAKIRELLTDDSAWKKLQAIGDEWARDEHLGVIRNKIAFHLGQMKDFQRGLDVLLQDPTKPRVVLEADNPTVADLQWHLGIDMLFAGLSVADEKHAAFEEGAVHRLATRLREVQGEIAPLVNAIFEQAVEVSEQRAKGAIK